MTGPFAPAALALLAALAVSGCDPRLVYESKLSPREVQTLAGTFQGEARMTFGEETCPRVYQWSMKVTQGSVEGSMVDEKTPHAPPSVFKTFIEYDGSLNAFARPSGRDTNIRGAFVTRESFFGEAKGPRCRYTVRLFRAASS
jgi:hypothetical protein